MNDFELRRLSDDLRQIKQMLYAFHKGTKHLHYVDSYSYGRTEANDDPFIVFYPVGDHLQKKACKVYKEDFGKLPSTINTNVPADAIDYGTKDKAAKRGELHECPVMCILTVNGKDTQMGPEKRFYAVLWAKGVNMTNDADPQVDQGENEQEAPVTKPQNGQQRRQQSKADQAPKHKGNGQQRSTQPAHGNGKATSTGKNQGRPIYDAPDGSRPTETENGKPVNNKATPHQIGSIEEQAQQAFGDQWRKALDLDMAFVPEAYQVEWLADLHTDIATQVLKRFRQYVWMMAAVKGLHEEGWSAALRAGVEYVSQERTASFVHLTDKELSDLINLFNSEKDAARKAAA
jgi:hypothetical protein